jgi:lysylphosphatidylglycerol synthetase-like protein (DUF2156 family)
MTIRRDHIAGAGLIAFGALVVALSADLPFGTPASPGPGMLPMLVVSVLFLLAIVLLLGARQSPAMTQVQWDDLPHALIVIVAAILAAALYTTLGFMLTFTLLLLGLMVVVERMPLLTSLAISIGVAGGAWLLLGRLLKTPLPQGILFGY